MLLHQLVHLADVVGSVIQESGVWKSLQALDLGGDLRRWCVQSSYGTIALHFVFDKEW